MDFLHIFFCRLLPYELQFQRARTMNRFFFSRNFRCSHEIAAHASSLVLRSEVVMLVFFNILNDYRSDTMI
ncbi:hypothetical protein PAHAL_5G453300 [Panicum hallii]|uniref:Uncharacterized protein n=1 Tax=Panicum hallii TaxID=206008 RepID=A0A270R5P8_9POAL|nr:hypothetical protein PAHAL_5G453300 [Panicum hallii]